MVIREGNNCRTFRTAPLAIESAVDVGQELYPSKIMSQEFGNWI